MDVIAEGTTTLREVYTESHHQREERIFIGDSVFARYIAGLSQGSDPLVQLSGDDNSSSAPTGNQRTMDAAALLNRTATLTETGRAVVKGQRDWITINGIDRWLGGVHLSGDSSAWRWDEAAQALRHHQQF